MMVKIFTSNIDDKSSKREKYKRPSFILLSKTFTTRRLHRDINQRSPSFPTESPLPPNNSSFFFVVIPEKMPVTTCTSSLHLPLSLSSSRVRASFDTQQRLSYNPNAPRKIKKPPLNLDTNSNSNKSDVAIAKPPTSTVTPTSTDQSVFDLLKHPTQGIHLKFFCLIENET